MTTAEVVKNCPNVSVFIAYFLACEAMFFAGYRVRGWLACFLGFSLFIIGVIATPNVFPSPPIQITPIVCAGLAAGVFLGILSARLGNSSNFPETAAIYGISWLLASYVMLATLLFSMNSLASALVYVDLLPPYGAILCGFAGAGFCAIARLSSGNWQKKIGFACAWFAVGLASLVTVVGAKETFCKPYLASFAQHRARQAIKQILDLELEFQQKGRIDRNKNGTGEYAFLSELIDASEKRSDKDFLDEKLRLSSFQPTTIPGVYEKNFYFYTVYLVGDEGYVRFPPAENKSADTVTARERWFACYAWPTLPSKSKLKAFAAIVTGTIYSQESKYIGNDRIPEPETPRNAKDSGDLPLAPGADWKAEK